MRFGKTLMVVGVGLAALLLSGCETVQPWEKGNLADYTMRDDRDELESVMTAHVTFSREASTGGEGVGGGGCGCN
ncbi:DUF4266 domain-containing protein [Pelagicoccus mobilis]|uniref:DUF4266 domain-containing protein n=1 Tax=Pelagicoccus mobilis TaxID=415221 RepID=A0A934S1E3_9BACT|nr:DUF4266 domain-containing protein [Pelagicoccus mobilis]MBK1880586.1 DUF4266 domain-containing protein [Pelagicoccus mobilis]